MVAFTGDRELLYRANLGCRCAVRILQPIATFELDPALDAAKALYAGLSELDWAARLRAEGTLAIDPVVHNSPFANSLYAAQVAKDAIADWFRQRTGRRPSVAKRGPDLRINLHIDARRVTVYLDSSDDSLHKRGYRGQTGEAPLNEVLAAGILRLTGWGGAPTGEDTRPLVDFMCGSGTLPIEAALMLGNIAPGLVRKEFGYLRWPDVDRTLHERLLDEARAAQRPIPPGLIFGSDIDEQAIAAARQGATRAGVAGAIRYSVANFEAAVPPGPSGTLVFNPPYDERLKVDRIAALYRRIGDVLKRGWSGYTAWMFTGNLEAARQIGLRSAARIRLFNGPIECRLLKFPLFTGAGGPPRETPPAAELPIADDVSQSADADEVTDDEAEDLESPAPARPAPAADQTLAEFRNRLKRMGKHWSRWARRQGIECYRVYDRDIPEVPLTIDRYGRWLHVVEHARPHGRTPIEHRQFFERLIAAAGEELGVRPEDVFAYPRDAVARGRDVAERLRPRAGPADCQRVRAAVADQSGQSRRDWPRAGRARAAPLDRGRSTGQAVLERVWPGRCGQRGCRRRGRRRQPDDRRHAEPGRLVARESRTGQLRSGPARRRGGRGGRAGRAVRGRGAPPFDLVLAAPPAGYHRRAEHAGWDPKPELLALLRAILPLVVHGGKIYFVTAAKRFRLEPGDLPLVSIRDLTRRSIPPDFQARPPHRCWAIVKE